MIKVTRSQLKKRCDALASKYYRQQTPYCEARGLDLIRCGGVLQWCHIFSRSNLRLRYEPYNKLIMCQGHHSWYTHNPIEWTRFLERHFPERVSEAELHRNEYQKIDYPAWIELFKGRSVPSSSGQPDPALGYPDQTEASESRQSVPERTPLPLD
jgi:hypothetical protein